MASTRTGVRRCQRKQLRRRNRRGWKVLLGLGLAAPVVAGVALFPSVAVGAGEAPVDEHAAHTAGVQAELAQVRAATARFHRVEEAVAAGYELGGSTAPGCGSSPASRTRRRGDGVPLLQRRPDGRQRRQGPGARGAGLRPAADGGLKLVAVEWVARSAQSNPPGVSQAPSVLGMDMHILVPPPGPAFYLTHAWVWADNPAGMFADWNPEVTASPRHEGPPLVGPGPGLRDQPRTVAG